MRPECETIEPLVSAYIDGELEEADVSTVKEHLAGCADCRKASEEFRKVDGLYGQMSASEPTAGRWSQMLWNVLPRAEVPRMPAGGLTRSTALRVNPEHRGVEGLTAGPRRIPMNISGLRSTRWAGYLAGALAVAGMVLLAVIIIINRPSDDAAGPGVLAGDNTVLIVELDSTAEGYEVALDLPMDSSDLLVIDVTRTEGDHS